MNETRLRAAHKASSGHREELNKSRVCGCFYCLETFPPSEISDGLGDTARCPRCSIDSVIGSASEWPVDDPDFLKAMHRVWF